MKRILLICAFLLALAVQAGAQSKQQQQQPVEVNGLVVDSDDVPIVGATVYIKDEPGIGSITNSEGRFKLTAKLYNTLAVSFMGYETAEQIITSAADVKITLREGNQMEEVVVIGMGTQRKVSVTGAVAVVDTKDLELPATNIVNTLGGRVPGVISIQSSGEPGRNISEFWVRGIGTFGANSGALVLIDGLEGNLSQIDPADVESFSVLKDAAATAVYGSRGANGVVLVTTKRGKQEQLKITFRSNYTISELRRLPRYVGATQYAEMANEAAVASGMSPIYNDTQMDIIRYGLDPDLYPDIDWQDVILNPTSFQHTQYVSAQGGGNIARYFASLGMSQESSAYKSMDDSKYNKGVGYDTYNFRTNIDINLTKTTQIYLGAMGFMSVNKRPSMGKKYSRTDTSLTDWIWDSQSKTTPLMYPLRYSSGELPASGSDSDIPPHVLLNYTGNTVENKSRTLFNIGIKQDLSMLTEGLNIEATGSWDSQSLYGESRYSMPALYLARERNQKGELILSEQVTEASVQYNSEAWNWRKLYFDAKVNYDRTFGNHRVGGLLFYYLESTTESGADSSMNAIARRYQSLSGRFTYGFKDTYFLDVNFGLNGSENFQSGRQYGFFPAVAVGWVPTQYEFMKRIKWIDFMKIRASYGMVGNDRISSVRFPYLTIIEEKTDGTPWGGSGVLTENRVGADNLAWEKAKKFDIGMDLHLFGDRFTMTVDYFRDRREGIFQERAQIPDYVGVISMPYGNVGSMTSWGGDGNFEYFQPLGKNFHFTLRGNFTLSKNKINNWEEATQPYPYLSKTGFSNDVQRGFISLGLFKDQQDVDMSPEQFGTVRPGDIKYKDVNGDGVITDDDKVPLFAYSGIPQFMYGFGAEVRYKNWTLNVLFKGTGNNYFLYGDKDGSKFDGYIPFNGGYKGNVLALAYNPANRWTSADYSGDREPQCAVPAPFLRQQRQQHQTLDLLERQCPLSAPAGAEPELQPAHAGAAQSARPAIHRLPDHVREPRGMGRRGDFRPRAGHADRARLPDPAPLLAADLPELLTRISPKNINYHEKIIHHTPRAGRPAHRVVQLPERGRLFRGHLLRRAYLREPIQHRALFQRCGEPAAQRGPHLLLVQRPRRHRV